jgi:hypothetical protein
MTARGVHFAISADTAARLLADVADAAVMEMIDEKRSRSSGQIPVRPTKPGMRSTVAVPRSARRWQRHSSARRRYPGRSALEGGCGSAGVG